MILRLSSSSMNRLLFILSLLLIMNCIQLSQSCAPTKPAGHHQDSHGSSEGDDDDNDDNAVVIQKPIIFNKHAPFLPLNVPSLEPINKNNLQQQPNKPKETKPIDKKPSKTKKKSSSSDSSSSSAEKAKKQHKEKKPSGLKAMKKTESLSPVEATAVAQPIVPSTLAKPTTLAPISSNTSSEPNVSECLQCSPYCARLDVSGFIDTLEPGSGFERMFIFICQKYS